MGKSATSFSCTACGQVSLRWMGRCPGCGEWNTLVETAGDRKGHRPDGPRDGRSGGRRSGPAAEPRKPVVLADVESGDVARLRTGSDELDRVLGGGLVPGSVVLIGGSPGIGKSTLMSAALASIQAAGGRPLYVSGEESAAQVKLRAERLGPHALAVPILAETALDVVLATLEQERPQACVIDSVQTLWSGELTGSPGSVGQVQEVAGALERFAREHGCAMILVGHVTKEGALAGPRVLEHAVDCVLQFEGERERSFRTLRALKNRFGSTNEIGVFEMRAGGLDEVADPSERFLRDAEPVPGSCVLCAMEGTRPLLVEVQALVAPTDVVPPRRVANGIDRNRLTMILAVLARHGGPSLGAADVFVNVAGGVRIDEPGADLAVALAVASAARGEPLSAGGAPPGCFGEVGLTGELRYVAHADRRLEEAARFGVERIVLPARCADDELPPDRRSLAVPVATLAAALETALGNSAEGRRAA
jgi:DNA repair protein RadA/Sms